MATCGQPGQMVIVKGPLALGNYRMPRTGTLKAKPGKTVNKAHPGVHGGHPSKGKASPVRNQARTEKDPFDALWLIMRMKQNC